MRNDIDAASVVRLHLIGRRQWRHKSGALVEAADYIGYRARTYSGDKRLFLSLPAGNLSFEWLDVTGHENDFRIFERPLTQ